MRCASCPASRAASTSERAMTRCPPSIDGGLDVTIAKTLTPSTRPDDPRGNADRNGAVGNVLAHHGGGADDGLVPEAHAVEDFRAGANPHALANRHAGRCTRLCEHGFRRIGEIVIAADD